MCKLLILRVLKSLFTLQCCECDYEYSEFVTDAIVVGSTPELFPTSKKHTEAAFDQPDNGNVHNRRH